MPASFDLIPFDPGKDSHAAFVYDTFRKSCAGVWPWSAMPKVLVMAALKRELAKPGTVTNIAVPKEMPDSFLGWYSARGRSDNGTGVVVYGFTKYSARRQGVALEAFAEMAVNDWHEPIGVVFWTPACARLACTKGWPLFFDTREAFDDAR